MNYQVFDMHGDDKAHSLIREEMAILKQLRHDNTVSYYGSMDQKDKLYLLMEFMDAGYSTCPILCLLSTTFVWFLRKYVSVNFVLVFVCVYYSMRHRV